MKAAVADPNIVKLDTRDVDEWIANSSSPYGKDFCPRKGRIPGAVWLEWYRMMKPTPNGPMFKSRDEILAECATVGVTPSTPVVLYCFKGARASNTLVALKEAGVETSRSISVHGTNGRGIVAADRDRPPIHHVSRVQRRGLNQHDETWCRRAAGTGGGRHDAANIDGGAAAAAMKGHGHGNVRQSV